MPTTPPPANLPPSPTPLPPAGRPPKPRVLVVGSVNQDVVLRLPRAPAAGETLLGDSLQRFPGGKGANQAVAAARLGASVAFLGNVGQDAAGEELVAHLQSEGICTTAMARVAHAPTGTALIMVEQSGQNRIIVVPGANYALSPEQVEAAAAWFDWAQIVLVQLEIPLPTVTATLQLAAGHHRPVLLNPAPAPTRVDLPQLLAQWWPLVDLLVPNESEAATLAQAMASPAATRGVSAPSSALPSTAPSADPRQPILAAAQTLLRHGVRRLLVTAGSHGALVAASSSATPTWIPAFPVNVVDTTAAGDAFCGGLAVALSQGHPLLEAARYASAVAALAVTRPGAQPSLPRAAEVEFFLHQAQA